MSIFRWRFWIPLAAMALLVILAAGLSQVSFVGTRYEEPPEEKSSGALPEAVTTPSSEMSPPWWAELVLIAAGAMLIISLIFLILNPKDLKEVLRRAVTLSLWVVALFIIIQRLRQMTPSQTSTERPGEGVALPAEPVQALPSFEQFQPPAWTIFFLLLAVFALCSALFYLLWRVWQARAQTAPLLTAELAHISERAVEDLRSGAALRGIILRCYSEMCQLLSERIQIAIARSMTVREFEKKLAHAGIQAEHIARLSRLFEWARYGDGRPTPQQEQEAVEALEIIARRYGARPLAAE